jgi:ribonuclease BN (tRNA processing enzyme)
VTLGTHGGPVPHISRSQPANLLLTGSKFYLVDVGDGAAGQMAKLGIPLLRLNGIVENTHYSFAPGSPQFGRYASLPFRFDLADRSILYTGDTGPSDAVNKLGHEADLLVAEIIDLDGLPGAMGPQRGDPDAGPSSVTIQHLRTQHITPTQIGEMAHAMDVGSVVVQHLVIGNAGEEEKRGYVAEIGSVFDGPVTIANDLDRFCSEECLW